MNCKIVSVLLLAFCLILGMFTLFYPLKFRLYQQTFANTIIGPFVIGNQAGEKVHFSLPNISRIDIRVATYNRDNNSILTCLIIQGEKVLTTRNINTLHFQDNELFSIYFYPPVTLDQDKGFSVLFQANAELEKKNYISLYLSSQNKSSYSHFFLNEEDFHDQNLWIRLYSRLTLAQVLRHIFIRSFNPWRVFIPFIILSLLAFVLWGIAGSHLNDERN